MSRLRVILSAGVCSVALSGCLPAAAGLALSAANLVTGGGDGGGNAFRNPIDRQSTGRQVRQALSRLDDRVDPACQAMLDEHLQTYGTLTAGGRPAAAKKDKAAAAPAKTEDKKPPVNLLAKVSLPAAGATDMAVSADTAGDKPGADDGRAAGTTAAEPVAPAPEKAVAAVSTDGPADAAPGAIEPVKASLGTAPAPGHC